MAAGQVCARAESLAAYNHPACVAKRGCLPAVTVVVPGSRKGRPCAAVLLWYLRDNKLVSCGILNSFVSKIAYN